MAYNEQNTVAHFINHQLTEVNLNALSVRQAVVQGKPAWAGHGVVKEDAVEDDTVKWK